MSPLLTWGDVEEERAVVILGFADELEGLALHHVCTQTCHERGGGAGGVVQAQRHQQNATPQMHPALAQMNYQRPRVWAAILANRIGWGGEREAGNS